MSLAQYRFRTELHAHTSPVSPCADFPPEEVVRIYAAKGYDAVTVTNHFFSRIFPDGSNKEEAIAYYLADYAKAVRAGEQYGIRVLFGMEARFPENLNDYLLYGVTPEDAGEVYDAIDGSFEAFSHSFRSPNRCLVQAHPFRDRMTRTDPLLLDGAEVFNLHPSHNARIGMVAGWAEENNLIVTGGTDFHHLGHEGMIALRTKECPDDSLALAEILRSRDYLFEIGGTLVLPYGVIGEPKENC